MYSIKELFFNFDKWLLEYKLNNSFFLCSINLFLNSLVSISLIFETLLSINLKNIKEFKLLIGFDTSPIFKFFKTLLTFEFKLSEFIHPILPKFLDEEEILYFCAVFSNPFSLIYLIIKLTSS